MVKLILVKRETQTGETSDGETHMGEIRESQTVKPIRA
nr:MAG TPA: hypothetical protein [Caudoviricetes sp.]